MSITIGTDPELFLKDTRTGGVVPVCGLVGGEKGKPLDLKDGYGVQEDNVMLEFNTPPAEDAYTFADSVVTGLNRSLELVRTKHEHLEFDTESERLFTTAALESKQALEFGCSVDYDAYTQGGNFTPVDPAKLEVETGAWRFAGGHVHVGYEKGEIPDFVAASFGDIFLGLPSVGLDKQPLRRALYGAPGRFRPTPYGIEYRVLSNFWVMETSLIEQVGHRAYAMGAFLESGMSRVQAAFKEIPWADVRKAIAEEDAERSADVMALCMHDLGMKELDL